jgi:carbon-monoxide dehydrogenase large subunit
MGTYGSRSLAVGGAALARALDKIVAKGRKIAAHLLEAAEPDVELRAGRFAVRGSEASVGLSEVAFAAYVPHDFPHEELEPGLEESAFYDPKNFTFPAGCHVVEVEVDPETGAVEVVRATAADDVGNVINPLLVEGQIHGGLAQGIGQALLEGAAYDERGQLLSSSYMQYAMPRASDFPFFEVRHSTTACTHNPLGAKGVGEVGAIGVPPAVIGALLDALAPAGVRDIEMPATPERVWRALRAARQG